MTLENVDKDPDLRKSSDLEQSSKSPVPRLIGLGAIAAAITGIIIVLVYYSPAWGPNQWGNVGTWVAGVATSLAVIVAVWQTNNANRQARAAEARADKELASTTARYNETMANQKAAALRDREWAAVQMVSRAVSTVLSEVSGIHEIDTLHDDLRTTLTTEYILDRRKMAVDRINESAYAVHLAFSQLMDAKLLINTQYIRDHIKKITDIISGVVETPDIIIWQEAQRHCGPLNGQNKYLQKAIVERFSEILEFPTGKRPKEGPKGEADSVTPESNKTVPPHPESQPTDGPTSS
ncbi:hypothetical protein [Rhodococcus qingshengii]|uniref:hypothetical protein n=1 Tax=Rhodococcus qingshengii TaxID=334542 RepID=UPI003018559C